MSLKNGFIAALTIAALATSACGGGSDGNGGGGGTTVSSTSLGEVTAFGSVVVNGVRWSTNGASLRLDDSTLQLVGEDNIRQHVPRGAVITVKGERNGAQGTATEIEFKSTIEGPIAGNGAGGFTIAGLTIAVDAATTLVDAAGAVVAYTPTALADGERVEVSGVPESATVLRASMVRKKAGNQPEFEAKGYVVGLSGVSFGLSLVSGGAPYLNVTTSAVLPVGLANGSIVEVKGAAFAAGTPGTLTATVVELEDRLFGSRDSEMEVEGVITGLGGSPNAETFTVAGQAVRLTATTQFVGAADPLQPRLDLADTIKVEVEGTLDAASVLVASKLKYKDGARLEAPVQAVASATSFTMLGKTIVAAPNRTRLDGISLATIAANQQLEVRGYPMVNGQIFAQRIRLRSGGNDRPFMQGVATTVAQPSVTLLGTSINLSGAEFRNLDDTALSQTQFFDALTAGQSFVKVKWERGATSTSDPVREAEIEND